MLSVVEEFNAPFPLVVCWPAVARAVKCDLLKADIKVGRSVTLLIEG